MDEPVRGNSKVGQELEGAFRGAGWNVIKVVWGSDWDALFEKDTSGLLLRRIEEVVDGELLKYVVEDNFIYSGTFLVNIRVVKIGREFI